MNIPKNLQFVELENKGRSILANRDIKKEEVILKLKGILKSRSDASPESVQIDDDKFIDSKYYYVEDYINHSCDPNTYIDFNKFVFIALKNIHSGEEITYNYLTTEYDLAKESLDFDCKCKSEKCLGRVKGFKFLNKKQKLELKSILSPFLKKKL
jgi:SET domain-containing protein